MPAKPRRSLNKWRTVRILIEVPIRGCTDKAVKQEIERMIDVDMPQLNCSEVGRIRIKDFGLWKRGKDQQEALSLLRDPNPEPHLFETHDGDTDV